MTMCMRTRLVLGIADGGVPVWNVITGIPFMANAITTRYYPPSGRELWIDSGGYQALRKGERISLDFVISRFRSIEADYYVMLDFPPRSETGDLSFARLNFELFERLYEKLEDKTIIPVVHHYTINALLWILDMYDLYKPQIMTVGGSVPGLLNRGKKRAATIVYLALARKLWPRHLHVLGAGSPVMRCILSHLGIDTADTATWKAKAVYAKILIPGAGERYVGNRDIKYGPLYATSSDLIKLEKFLRETGFPLLEKFTLEELLHSFKGRAFINAWILTRVNPTPGKGYKWILNLAKIASNLSVEELVKLHEYALRTQKIQELVRIIST
ncbi:MAG: hypothetical protein GSR85_05835 [Desulfurococcales archaeon]|nr:hypothetical protein [Desulfurococcales archaeon]